LQSFSFFRPRRSAFPGGVAFLMARVFIRLTEKYHPIYAERAAPLPQLYLFLMSQSRSPLIY
jgi:hypothetical protein